MDTLPLWVIFLLAVALALLTIELGWRLGNRQRARHEMKDKMPVSVPVTAMMGLLAFLLAVTFSMAGARFDSRKQVVMQEANVIGTVWLRANFLPAPARTEMQKLLRDYTALRAGGLAVVLSDAGRAQASTMHDKMWGIVSSAVAISDTISIGLLTQSINELVDLDTVRVTANRNRIPDNIWVMLAIVAAFSFAALGYEFGLVGERSWALTILMTITFIAVITLIADLDRAQAGMLQVSQQSLLDLLNKIGKP